MRLIDKDYAVDTAWSIEVYHGSAREVCEMLEDAPTVDAVPVEWLQAHITTIEQQRLLDEWAERKEE